VCERRRLLVRAHPQKMLVHLSSCEHGFVVLQVPWPSGQGTIQRAHMGPHANVFKSYGACPENETCAMF